MKMYQHFVGEQSDHLPSNPSMRLRPDAQQKLKLSLDQFNWGDNAEEMALDISGAEGYKAGFSSEKEEATDKETEETETADETKSEEEVMKKEDEKGTESIVKEDKENIAETEASSKLPDYNRMYLWEKGQMDYTGSDSTNNIMKKLDSLISGTKIK